MLIPWLIDFFEQSIIIISNVTLFTGLAVAKPWVLAMAVQETLHVKSRYTFFRLFKPNVNKIDLAETDLLAVVNSLCWIVQCFLFLLNPLN